MATSLDLQCLSSTEHICQYLKELERDVEKKIKKLECDCSQLQLLFKPWPKNGKGSNNIKAPINDDKCLSDERKRCDEQMESSNPIESPAESLTPAEREALNAMEKLLAKAQKARTLQKKTEDCPKSYSRTVASSSQKKELKIDENEKAKSVLSNEIMNSSSKTSIKKPSEKSNAQSRKFSRNPAPPSNKSHIKAPFQTNPGLSFPKNSTNQEAMIRGTKNKKLVGRGHVGRVGTKSTTRAPAVTDQRAPTVTEKTALADNDKVKSASQSHSPDPVCGVSTRLETTQRNHSDADDVSPRSASASHVQKHDSHTTQACHIDSKSENVNKNCDDGDVKATNTEPHKDNRFNLYRDGSQVEIPSKLRKLVSVNHRLRQKLSVVRVTKKVDSTKSGQDFIESVERLFEQDPGYKSALAAQRVEHEYRNLGKMLEGLTDDTSIDETPVYEVLRTKNILETVLTRFYQLQEEWDSEDIDCINELALCQVHRESKWNPPPPTTRSDILWSPFSSECVLPELNSRVQYRSTKQLERYIHLMFQIQYQHLVCLLQQSFISVITKQMESPGLSASDYLQLLRTLCFMTNSKTYPVVVVDTMETDKDSSD